MKLKPLSKGLQWRNGLKEFDFIPSVCILAKKYPKIIFILTNQEPKINLELCENMFYSTDIIRLDRQSDLNENAFCGTFCDVIVGRASSVFTFCFNQKTLFEQNVNMISFSYETENYAHYLKADWLGKQLRDKIKYKAKIIHSAASDGATACRVIDNIIYEYSTA